MHVHSARSGTRAPVVRYLGVQQTQEDVLNSCVSCPDRHFSFEGTPSVYGCTQCDDGLYSLVGIVTCNPGGDSDAPDHGCCVSIAAFNRKRGNDVGVAVANALEAQCTALRRVAYPQSNSNAQCGECMPGYYPTPSGHSPGAFVWSQCVLPLSVTDRMFLGDVGACSAVTGEGARGAPCVNPANSHTLRSVIHNGVVNVGNNIDHSWSTARVVALLVGGCVLNALLFAVVIKCVFGNGRKTNGVQLL
jgi:hypothetical protein